MAQRRIKQRLGRFLLLCLSVFWIGGVVYAYQLSPMFPQVNAIDEEETPQSVLEKYQTELSEVYQSYKGTIESYYDVVQNEYLPQLESTYNTHYGAMQSLYDNYDDLTQDILVFSSDMYNECVAGKNELREIYNAAQSRQTVVNKNEVALQDVQKYQTELSEVYNTYKEEIESLDESVQGSYLSQLFDVYNSFNVQLQTLIDNYYVSYSLSDHVNEAAEYCSSGKTELKNIRDNAFETTNPVQNPSISLQEVPFWLHEDGLWGLNAPKNTQVTADWVVGESTGVPYGDSMVNNWADLSGYDKLVVTVTEGAPRILLNRDVDEGSWNDNEEESHLIDNSQGGWSSKYFTQETTTNGDVYTVDLKQIKTDKGFVHLHAIKGASWANVTVTSMMVELDGNPEVVITSSGDGTVDWSIPTGVGVVNANSQSDAISVQYDGELTLTFTPNTGYHLSHVYVNNVDYVNQVFGNALTLNVTQNTAVRAVFATDTNNVQLTADMFYDWDGFGPFAQKTGQTTQVYVVGEPTEVAYGDPNVISFADLSAYSRLEVTVTEGTPRFLFNREYNYGLWCSDETMSHMIEYPNEGWSSKYFSHEGNVWSVDLKQMVADKGYAHLHAIKAPWNTEITVTKMELVDDGDNVYPEAYAVPSEGNTTLTFYYDTNKSSHEDAMSVVPFSSSESRGWDSYASNITKVEFDKSFANCLTLTSTANWFSGCNNLTTINGIRYIKTPEVTDMQQMFFSCSSLTSLDLSSFNTAKVSSMLQMFFGCSALTTIYVGSGWNVASLSNAETMFEGCDSLVGGYGTAYDANYIDNSYARIDYGTSNPGYLTGKEPLLNEMMFAWDGVGAGAQKTSQAYSDYVVGESTDNAFGRANVDIDVYVDLSSYSRLEVTSTEGTPRFLFNRDVTDGEPSENEAESHLIDNTHEGCMTWASKYFSSKPIDGGTLWMVNLEQLVQDKGFAHLHAIKGANDANVTVTKMDLVVAQNVAIEPEAYAVWTENFVFDEETGEELRIQALTFYYDTNKNSYIGVDNTTVYPISDGGVTHEWRPWCLNFNRVVFDESFALYKPTSTASWFDGMENLTAIKGIENLNTKDVTDMNSMFLGCKTLTSIDLSHFKTANVTSMARMFYGCSALNTLDMTSFNTSKVMYMGEMFYNCAALKTIYVGSEWTTAALTGSESMFAGCSSLVGGQGTVYDASHVDAEYAHIDGGTSNPGYFTEIKSVRRWDFTNWSATTIANLRAEASKGVSDGTWSDIEKSSATEPTDLSKDNCFWEVVASTTGAVSLANGEEIAELAGLQYTNTKSRSLAIAVNYQVANASDSNFGPYHGTSYLWLGSSKINYFTIPHVMAGTIIKIGVESHKLSEARGVELSVAFGGTTLLAPDGSIVDAPTTYQEQEWLVPTYLSDTPNDDGTYDIQIYNTNGCHIYYITLSVPPTPTFSRSGNMLTITTTMENATIYYTLDGTTPTTESNVYQGPFELTQNCTVRAIAVADGSNNSPVGTYVVDWFGATEGSLVYPNLSEMGLSTSSTVYLPEGTPIGSNSSMDVAIACPDDYYAIGVLRDDMFYYPYYYFNGEKVSRYYGIWGQTNPKDSEDRTPGQSLKVPVTGTAFSMKAKKDGYMYVWGVFSTSKYYSIFEDSVAVGYRLAMITNGWYREGDTSTLGHGRVDIQFGQYHQAFEQAIPNISDAITNDTTNTVNVYGEGVMVFPVKANSTYIMNGNGCKFIFGGVHFNESQESLIQLGSETSPEFTLLKSGDEPLFVYEEKPLCPSPVFEPNKEMSQLSISCTLSDATIYYTTDGSIPNTNSTKYTTPLVFTDNCVVKSIAVADGYTISEVSIYTVNWFSSSDDESHLYVVTFNGQDEEYHNGTKMDIPTFFSFSEGDSKHNFNSKFNGTYNGIEFSKGLKMEGTTLVAFTSKAISTVTIVQSTWSDYTIKFDDTELDVANAQVAENCRIYTIDSLPIGYHAITRGSGESGLFYVSVEYSKCPLPTFVLEENVLSINCNYPLASIYYTIDGSTPTTNSTEYTTPMALSDNCTIKAIAVANGLANSDVAMYNVDCFTDSVKYEPYFVLSEENTVLTFYYDKKREERGGRVFQSGTEVYWPNYVTGVTKVSFDESFADFSPTSTSSWFAGFNSLTSIEGMEYLNTTNVTSMISMFQYCENLTALDLSGLQTGNVETMTNMFYGCQKLANLNISGFNTANVTSLASMFYGCQSLTTIDLSSFNTSNVTRMEEMFQDCAGLTTLDLSMFNTGNVENMSLMFVGCTNLATIYAGSGWSVAKVTDSNQMFYDCYALVGGQGTVYDADHTDYTYAHIDGGTSNPGYLTLKLAMGDANGDGNINIADAVATVTNILGQPTEATFYQYAADMNTDQVIDIFDVTLIVNAAFDAASPAPVITRGSADNIMMEHISMTADADYIYLGIDQPERFTATQFDVTLPEGMELVDARLASATTDHQLSFVKRGENEYRVIGLSMSNATFRSLNGQLIKLEVSGSAVDSDVKVSNVLFVTPTATVITSIDKCLNTAKVADDSFYDLKGQRVSKQQLGKGIYIMNHKKVIIK